MGLRTPTAWSKRLPINQIEHKAMELGVDPCLVASIVSCESGGDPYSARFEPNYKYLYKVNEFAALLKITPETEECHQKTSFGLMQVMGGVARELGFRHHLLALTDPIIGLHFGCLKLKKLHERWVSVEDVVAAYNAGSPRIGVNAKYYNQAYVDKVMSRYRELVS